MSETMREAEGRARRGRNEKGKGGRDGGEREEEITRGGRGAGGGCTL